MAAHTNRVSLAMERTGQWVFSQDIPTDILIQVGEAKFPLHKFMLVAKSNYIRRLILESKEPDLAKLDLSNIPGGAEIFEKAAKFCYGVNFEITVHNVAALRCAAEYLDMTDGYCDGNLAGRTDDFLVQVALSSLSGAVVVLKSCEDLLPMAEHINIVQRCVEVASAKACNEANFPSRSPPNWWTDELSIIHITFFEKIIKSMTARGAKPLTIASAIITYTERSLPDLVRNHAGTTISTISINSTARTQQQQLVQSIINLLPVETNRSSFPINFLCCLLRTAIFLGNDDLCKKQLEKRITAMLEHVTVDDLLVLSYTFDGERLFDLESVRRIISGFVEKEKSVSVFNGGDFREVSSTAMLRVAKTVDAYLGEIATCNELSISKFNGVANLVPKNARKFDDDLYRAIDIFLKIQEEYVKDEQKNLKRELLRSQEEVKRIQSVPLVIGQFMEMIDQNNGIVGSTTGSNYYVRILSTINRELLKPSASVALHRHSNALVDVLPPEADSSISLLRSFCVALHRHSIALVDMLPLEVDLSILLLSRLLCEDIEYYKYELLSRSEKPDVTYADIGGCDIQKQEIREAVELPLTHHELYKQIGIDPPRGVLLYGPPGTGKTMLAKAVANHTTAAFIRVVGSEFVQKYLGEGPRMVRDVFRLAKENAPAIIFIDEVDAIATARFDAQTGADREVQRILMELLNQMDGFDQTVNVKVIMATNRADTLDPALLRPGRLDRKIEFPLPDRRQKRLVFQVCTAKMNLSDEVDLEDYVSRPDKISAAEITAICQEAGMHAVRKNRYVILPKDFEKGYRTNVKKPDTDFDFYK
ncbi:BTB/POZ-like protein [Artemisia annua]|uniref:26S proteasome regulatory subunit 6B homolog n=1 Tax=Artemisia annua TaxID=35608 RepID=A0A2U1N5A7_ARTAN|nr:BTB/POZ-like protein [Artemisia annua]